MRVEPKCFENVFTEGLAQSNSPPIDFSSTLVSCSLLSRPVAWLSGVVDLLYSLTFKPIIEAIRYRDHEICRKAKLTGIAMTIATSQKKMEGTHDPCQIIRVINGLAEKQFLLGPYQPLEAILPEIDRWLQTLPKKTICHLADFTTTVYGLPADNRWISFFPDRRTLFIIDLLSVVRQKDFVAQYACGEFNLFLPYAEGVEAKCSQSGKMFQGSWNLSNLMKDL